MMFQDDMMPKPAPAASDDKDQSSGNSQKAGSRPPAEVPRCPRCDSPNTKFCYYNNYSLSQPRYFCKTCRRYWTKGGALRNIPIGGGSRKNKKISKPSASSSSIFSGDSIDSAASSSYLDHINGFKFSNIGLSSGMDFHGNNNFATTFSPINHYQQLSTNSSFGNISRPLISNTSTSCFGLENFAGNSSASAFMGYNFPLSSPSGLKQDHGTAQVLLDQDRDIKNNDHIVASSIESLSSINQDLHWKLQQQRLGMSMVFGGENVMANQKELSTCTIIPQKPQPILLKNLEISSSANDHVNVHQGHVVDLRKDNDSQSGHNGGLATEWFFDHNSNYSLVNPTQTNSSNTGIDGANEAWCNLYQHAPLP